MKRVLVTGGSGALGGRIVRELAKRGARVAFTYCDSSDAAMATREAAPGSSAHCVDLTRLDALGASLDAMAHELGGVDALVHAAALTSTVGRRHWDSLSDATPEGWDALFAVNVRSAFFAARHLVEHLANGNVVLVGSVDGVKALPAPIAYATSKAALSGLARVLAKELGPKNVRVNVLAPGLLEAGASEPVPAELRAEYVKHASLKRVGTLDEAARVIAAFALTNTYVTGQTISIDGGL